MMDGWVSIITAVVASGILTTIITAIQKRGIVRATANNSNADYTSKIIAQSDARVAQALEDKNRAVKERDDAYADAKGQRKAKQEWREKFFAEQKAHHEAQLTLKDTLAKLASAEWHRCDKNGCVDRKPPRKRD